MRNLLSTLCDNSVTSLVIGKFDGLHRAHRELFSYLDEGGAAVMVRVSNINLTPASIADEFLSFPVFEVGFEEIRELSGADFFKLLMKKFPNLGCIIVGYDFRCGKNRDFGASDIASVFGGRVIIVPQIAYKGEPVHASTIKQFLIDGKIFQANELLGRPYAIEGEVVSGQGLGKKELIPTLNIAVEGFVLPKNGVYATYAQLGNSLYRAVSFIGKRLSTDNRFAVETHLLSPEICDEIPSLPENASLCLYGICIPHIMRVYFVKFLRENRKFENLESLRKQIQNDIVEAKLFHKKYSLFYNIWFHKINISDLNNHRKQAGGAL